MIGFYDNPEEQFAWRKYLTQYTPIGVRVRVSYPYFRTIDKKMPRGTIRAQRGEGAGAVFIVDLDRKDAVPWSQFTRDWDNRKRDALMRQLYNFDCLKTKALFRGVQDMAITCIHMQWLNLEAIDMKRGQPVEYQEEEHRHVDSIKSTPGIVQAVHKNNRIVDLFLFEPIPWMRLPYAVDTSFIKPQFLSSVTNRLSKNGVYEYWKEISPRTIPPGRMSEDGKEYVLDEYIPLEMVQTVCQDVPEEYDERLRCWLGGALFHVVPIRMNHISGTFRPMRRELAGKELPYIVTKEDIEKLEEEEE